MSDEIVTMTKTQFNDALLDARRDGYHEGFMGGLTAEKGAVNILRQGSRMAWAIAAGLDFSRYPGGGR